MATVTIIDYATNQSSQLDQHQSAIVVSEINNLRPNWIERLLMRLFPGPNKSARIAPDFEIVVEDGGTREVFQLLSETVLRQKKDRHEFNFFLGDKLIAWHNAQTASPTP